MDTDKQEELSRIADKLSNLANPDFYSAVMDFWQELGYNSPRQPETYRYSYQSFVAAHEKAQNWNENKVKAKAWKELYLLFQITDDEIKVNYQPDIFGQKFQPYLRSYLFAALELKDENYNRSVLAEITRHINRCYAIPMILTIKHGSNKISISIINRRINKTDSTKDVLEKVVLIKDVMLNCPHRAHLEILSDLSLQNLSPKHNIGCFDDLHKAWEQTLDVSLLTTQFYKDIRNWFLWAIQEVKFPFINPELPEMKDFEHQKISVIRLLTRFMFCWFLKEKGGLLPDDIFNVNKLPAILKQFNASSKESSYYNAILQNLFFAILSVPQNERTFIKQGYMGKTHDYGNTKKFRHQRMFNDSVDTELLFKGIPFLNGGLFDCMDRIPSPENEHEIRMDGFSETDCKSAKVPNSLFFSDDEIELENNAGKLTKTKVHGLINIFQKFKFTVEENTQVDEEIALDPILLGRVFEELLAFYNPETQIAAKSQTGAFYTPPEIADYMIIESLRRYLENYLSENSIMPMCDASVGLEILLSYTEKDHPFSNSEAKHIVKAIDVCKIIDPACGSGVFLMGMLHKIEFILQKIDPDNKIWFNYMLQSFPSHLRDEMEKKSPPPENYLRKLGIIQNCLYGVDIQPIAIQISKLRFFLTLLIEQNVNHELPNHGIKELPNLEFKLICADSILRLQPEHKDSEPDQITIPLPNIQQDDFQAHIHDYFSASNPKTKMIVIEKLKTMVGKMVFIHEAKIQKKLNKISYFTGQTSKKLMKEMEKLTFEKNQWNSFFRIFNDRPILFFEHTYQFPDTNGGFDIVIANPPYIKFGKGLPSDLVDQYELMEYATFTRNGDIYCLFYEQAVNILKPKGILCYITSNKWLRSDYGNNLRHFLKSNTTLLDIIDFAGHKVFKSASVDTNILVAQKAEPDISSHFNATTVSKNMNIDELATFHTAHHASMNQSELSENGWTLADNTILNLKAKIEAKGKALKDWDVNIYYGIKTGCNDCFIIDTPTKENLVAEDPKSAEIIKPILRGRDIHRYHYQWDGLWVIAIPSGWTNTHRSDIDPKEFVKATYPSVYKHLVAMGEMKTKGKGLFHRDDQGDYWWELRDCTYYNEFEKEKIVWQEIAQINSFSYDTAGVFNLDTSRLLTGTNLKALLGVFNSRLFLFAFGKFYAGGSLGTKGIRYKSEFMKDFPIPDNHELLIRLESEVSSLLRLLEGVDVVAMADHPKIKEQDHKINQLVYQLYDFTPEEIQIVESAI